MAVVYLHPQLKICFCPGKGEAEVKRLLTRQRIKHLPLIQKARDVVGPFVSPCIGGAQPHMPWIPGLLQFKDDAARRIKALAARERFLYALPGGKQIGARLSDRLGHDPHQL